MEKTPSIKGRPLKLLIPERKIKTRVRQLAKRIQRDMGGPFLVVGLLKGSFIFVADLIRFMEIPVQVDFMWVSSYGSSQESEGNVRVIQDLSVDIKNRKVLLVDDILDTGYTLREIVELLRLREPADLKVCVLLDKKPRRKVHVDVDYVGFEVPDMFLVGYGLDWDEEGRNLRGIYGVV
ncbi:hypoxanthine phosphoribosyltransferase [Thermocrinis albus DSM 14484]|uniref:Hypoxanthine phosphoribosyltransferase n=1 Tax=Thermocrinis albus (strain DSM 14484 / JCM 11386 / HI 11/12) TaxID=638303 RepID=D3SNW9_THEAH|nr:hypoxanthine phosphoribosyltransferase [Thermocrinis albus]ADC88856.1 hypoxanthine phosphoribosyltransferase [Thermocrinis albus DSM 14484]